jgi:hypothetical protein
MAEKPVLSLQTSEGILVHAAATIYAAYVTSGRVPQGDETSWMKRSLEEAFWLARATDEVIQSDTELG